MNKSTVFLTHLMQFKKMLLRFGLIYLFMAAPFIYYSKEWFEFCTQFSLPTLSDTLQLIATDITSAFMIPLKWALLSGFLVTLPLLFIQIWRFIAPGLYPHEKKWARPVWILGLILFYIGAGFALKIVCPMAIGFFNRVAPNNVTMMTDIQYYYDFVMSLMLAFGVSFEIPIVVFILIQLGWVTPEMLIKKRPYVIVGAFVMGMLLTPPDVVSQVMLAIPLWLLFESGLFLSKLTGFRGQAAERRQ